MSDILELRPMINGRSYGWADVSITINMVKLIGVTAINYSERQEKSNVFGAGRYPVSRGYGKITALGSIMLSMESVVALSSSAKNGQLTRLKPFNIIVVYQPDSGPIVTDVLYNCEFTETNRSGNTMSTNFETQYELMISHIEWNKV